MRNKLLRSILTLSLGMGMAFTASAQLGIDKDYVEPSGFSVGMNLGISDLWGDIGTQSPIDHYGNEDYFNNLHGMGGFFVRYSAHPAFAMRLGVNYGALYANDNWNYTAVKSAASPEDDAYQRYIRNQNVRSNTWEPYFMFELAPLRFNPESRGAMRRFQPYIMAGVSYFHFKPQTEYKTRAGDNLGWVDLYDLNVEGNGISVSEGFSKERVADSKPTYKLWQLAIPLGIGVKWDIGRRLALGVEYNYRYCFTDYLDNTSYKYISYNDLLLVHGGNIEKAQLAYELADRSWQVNPDLSQKPLNSPGQLRGNPSVNDSYSTFGIMLIFKVKNKKSPWWY